jgi:hypothetical protein
MREAVQLVKWLERWARRLEKNGTVCGLGACSGPKSSWSRLWGQRGGAFLQGVFYCRRQCLETALTAQLARLHALPPVAPPANRIPLGLLMVARGWLTHEQVVVALDAQQRAQTGQIGEWFERLGFATEQQVTSALGLQWGCPVTHSLEPAASLPMGPIPLGILEAFQMMPLHFVPATNTIYLAFGQRVDHAALYAIEKLLDCRTQPCVAGRKMIADELTYLRQKPRPRELEFGPMHDFAEIGRVGVSYMVRLGADEARLGRVGEFIWLRLRVGTSFTDLLFRTEFKGERKQFSVPGSQFSERPLGALKLRAGY